MPLTTAQAALQVPGARAISLILVKARDPAAGDAVVEVGIADGHFITEPGDTPASFPFDGLLAEGSGVNFSEFLTRAGMLSPASGGGSEIGRGDLEIEARDEQAFWRDLDWNGAEFTAYVGARHRADGELMVFAEFDVAFSGLVERMDALGGRRWRMSFADPRAALEEPATEKFYRGFGGGYLLPGAVGTELTGPGNSSIDLGPDRTLDLVGRLLTLHTPPGSSSLLDCTWGPTVGSNQRILLRAKQTGQVEVGIDTGGALTFLDSGHFLTEGDPFYLAVVVSEDGLTVELYAGRDADDTLPVWDTTLGSALVANPWKEIILGNPTGMKFEAWEAGVWGEAKTQEELEEIGDGPITDASSRADVLERWRFAEGAVIGSGPTVAFGEKGVCDLDFGGSGTPTWVSSYEGDDPDLFPGSPAGQTKARTWGPAENVKLTLVDSQRPAYVWHHVENPDDFDRIVYRLRQRGVPMVRSHSVTSNLTASMTFTAATNTITLSVWLNRMDFRLFIPGQQSPARLGQRIKISNTSFNNGTFRVAVDGISPDGLTLKVTDGQLVDETPGPGAKVESLPADIQWTGHELEDPPRVTLPSAPDGDPTADIIALNVDGFSFGLWSQIHNSISGKTVHDAAVTFDPILAYRLEDGSDVTRKDALDRIARASFGWWIERPDGDHDLGTWAPPSGTPVAALTTAHISEVEPLATIYPRGKFEIAHSPIWHLQDGDALAGSVSPGDRKRWSEPFTVKPVVNRRVRDDRFPLSKAIPRLETFVSSPTDVAAYQALAEPFHFREARWFRLKFDSLWPLFIRRNDCVTVSWDDPDLELDETLCRVSGREVDLGRGTIELEVFFLKPEPT